MIKKLIAILAFALALPAFAQLNKTTPVNLNESYGQGVYSSPAYNYQGLRIIGGGSTGTGAYSIQLATGAITLPDFRRVNIFSNTIIPSITVGSGTLQETVTPSSVSGCTGVNVPIAQGAISPCTITATFSNAHGVGELVSSGDQGIVEASNDAANNGGGLVYWQSDCPGVTLSTSATTTTTTCFVPQSYVSATASVYVTTTITTSANYSIGTASHTATMVATCTSLTAGLNCSQFMVSPAAVNGGTAQTALLVTANANAGAGVIHLRAFGYTSIASNF